MPCENTLLVRVNMDRTGRSKNKTLCSLPVHRTVTFFRSQWPEVHLLRELIRKPRQLMAMETPPPAAPFFFEKLLKGC